MNQGRKKFEGEILEDWIERQKELRRAPAPPKRRQPRVTPMQSPRQRRALRQTGDAVRAIYGHEGVMNSTPTIGDAAAARLTRNPQETGPNSYRAGKETSERYPEPKARPNKDVSVVPARRAQVPPSRLPRPTQSGDALQMSDLSASLDDFIARGGR